MKPLDRVLDALRDQGCEPRQSGDHWAARCPAHDDQNPSLSVSEGQDGQALVHCHAGCSCDSVCESLDLFPAELFPPRTNPATPSTKPPGNPGETGFRSRRPGEEREPKRYDTAEEAISALEKPRGKCDSRWDYQDREGQTVGCVVRWDDGGSKDIRPVSRREDGWSVEAMPAPRPLYRLPEIVKAKTVYVVEGEKAAEAARSIGLAATTSPGGSNAASKADWSVLAGKEAVILPDNDEAGRKYAEEVCGILSKLSPPARVRVVHLDHHIDGTPMEKGDDLVEWIAGQGDAAEPAVIAQNLVKIVEQTPCAVAKNAVEPPLAYRPFPLETLPDSVSRFVASGAEAIGCDPAFVALPLLSALASAIGGTRALELKKGYRAPSILWTCIVGESGTSKSPAFSLAMQFTRCREAALQAAYAEAMKNYKEERLFYERDEKAWKNNRNETGPPPKEPAPPPYLRAAVGDVTIEALAPLLQENPRGLLVQWDELAGWFGSHDQYKSKPGGDESKWLSMHSGEGFSVDRKTGVPRTIYVPRAYVSITGGIQPGILGRVLSRRQFESGLAARMLFAWPPRRIARWTTETVDASAKREMEGIFTRLYGLEHCDSEDEPKPKTVTLSSEAGGAWVEFYNAHSTEQEDLQDDLAAAWSKLKELPARLALVLHCVEHAAQQEASVDEMQVGERTMRDVIALTEWFKRETRRVYEQLDADEDLQQVLADYAWIEKRDGEVTVAEMQRGHKRLKTTDEARMALQKIAEQGLGHFVVAQPGPQGGRPSEVFRLSTST